MTLTEDYCSFELSRLLKEKGFDGQTHGNMSEIPCVCYITHQMAMRWLRENNIIITPQPEYFSCDRCESWGIDIWAFGNYEKLPGDFPKYEEAVEAALKYCLTKLI